MDEKQPKPKSKRGFASMDPEKQREIARKGGKSVPAEKRSFSQSADLAAKAGQKGGRAVDPQETLFLEGPRARGNSRRERRSCVARRPPAKGSPKGSEPQPPASLIAAPTISATSTEHNRAFAIIGRIDMRSEFTPVFPFDFYWQKPSGGMSQRMDGWRSRSRIGSLPPRVRRPRP